VPPTVHTSAAIQAAFHELHAQFDGRLSAGVVEDSVNQAAADLQGSIRREALPEMLIRLVAVRLEHRLQPEHTAGVIPHLSSTGADDADLAAGR
jgi:hypothetical protein